MPSALLEIVRLLEASELRFDIERLKSYGFLIHVALMGRRIEITVDDDGQVDVVMFVGSEDVKVGMDEVRAAIREQ